MAIPFASYCIECQERRNQAKSGWGEGTTIPPYDHQWTVPEKMQEPEESEYKSAAPEEQFISPARGPIGSALKLRKRCVRCRPRNGSLDASDETHKKTIGSHDDVLERVNFEGGGPFKEGHLTSLRPAIEWYVDG